MFHLRDDEGDIGAFAQVFIQGQYNIHANGLKVEYIVDLGGHIGMASRWFRKRYPDAKIVMLEPEHENFAIASLNLLDQNVECRELAIGSVPGVCGIVMPGNQAPSSMAFRTTAVADLPARDRNAPIDVVTMERVMYVHELPRIDILKIDIEGAEADLFRSNTLWLSRVNMVIIELHEYINPGIAKYVKDKLEKYNIHYVTSKGENAIFTRSGGWICE